MSEQKGNEAGAGDSLFSLLVKPGSENNDLEQESIPSPGEGEESGGDEEKAGESYEKEYYTPQEFSDLLEKNPLDVEPDRVPPELMPAYKAGIRAYKNFQADYTRKTQMLKQDTRKPKDIYEAYEIDPEGVLFHIDGEINKARENADLEQMSTLINLKANLLEKKLRKVEQMGYAEKQYQEIFNTVRAEIPDIETKAQVLRTFAIQNLGFTKDEIDKLTDPSITGALAAKLTIAVNKAYELANIDKSMLRKEVKKPPVKLGVSGVSGDMTTTSIPAGTIKSLSYSDFEKLLKKVKSQF